MTSETETKDKIGLRKYKRTAVPLMIAGFAVTSIILAVTFFDKLPWTITIENYTKTFSFEKRLIFTIQLLFLDCFSLLFAIYAVISRRVSTIAINPLDPKGQIFVEQRQRILQNTLEQFVVKVILSLTLCTILESNELILLPVFTFLFLLGRLTFALGYPKYRSFGFIMHITSNTFVIGLISYRLFINGTFFQHIKNKSN